MKNKTLKIKRTIYSLLQLKAIFVGIAIFNFIVAYAEAKRVENLVFCFGQPWYTKYRFGDFPFFLLIAVFGLYFNKWWSNLIAISVCTPIIYEFIAHCIRRTDSFAFNFPTFLDQLLYEPGLGFQFIFAFTLFSLASISTIKKISPRKLRIS